jgi:PAS domain S-box-containing protein
MTEAARELEAARRVIDVLVRRLERADEQTTAEDRLAMLKTMNLLENTVENRTRELQLSEARYRALYDHSPDVLLTVGPEGHVTAWNQTAARILGETRLVGARLDQLFAPDVQHQVAMWRRRGYTADATIELPLATGQWVALNAAKIPGLTGAIQIVLHDVSTRRSLEHELDHANRLAAIGHLAAGVAHEINNPLAVIQLRLELFERQLRADRFDVPAASAQVRVLREHVLRIARIVRNLQTFARPRTEDRRPVSIADLQIAVAEITREARGAARLMLLEDPPGLAVEVDRGAAEQVLVNLVTNAAQAMKSTGTIRLKAWIAGPDRIGVAVEDEGPGMAPELVDLVFTPFVTDKQGSGGLGLGLSIAWRIVEDHGGVLRGFNLPGRGARFELSFPRARTAAVIEEEEPSMPPSRPLSLLLVDDEPSLVTMLTHFAELAGHRVVSAGTAEQALEALEKQKFDAVITDLRLPGMSGSDLAEIIAARWPALAKKTVFISGLFHSPTPGQRYLQKPFSQRQLSALLLDLAR